ncbi:TRAP transporter small permease [Mameliella alba]|nr:TRAP transporter small permease [Mameliella alba]MBY6171070.1 TRAP transporter small permease [Mameliella alba]MBY6176294.1 TRAP transporter small permease [Mameliella alba]
MTDGTAARLGKAIDRSVRWIGAAMLFGFSTIVVYVVFSRYALNHTPRWAEELPRLLLVWLTFIGAVSGFWRGTHFRAGLADLVFKAPALRRGVLLLATLATAAFLIVLGVNGARLAGITWSHSTTALDLPVGLFHIALPVTCALSLIVLLLGGWRK